MKLRIVFAFLFILILQGCIKKYYAEAYGKKKSTILFKGEEIKFKNPPNTIQITDDLFVDQTEITNLHYKEYLYWINSVYGNNHSKYLEAIPLREVWYYDSLFDTKSSYPEYYFDYPAYDDYPMVGISYEQAINYSSWRSDRVLEIYLIRNDIIEYISSLDSNNMFTIEKYFNSEYLDYNPDFSFPVPIYSLPTTKDFQLYANNIKSENKQLKYATFEQWHIDSATVDRVSSISYMDDNTKLIHTIGNVAEMTNVKGIAKGGSWHHYLEDCTIDAVFEYNKPTNWLGFRNVCRVYKGEDFLKTKE